MKKIVTLASILLLAISTAEAKRGGGMKSAPKRASTPAVQKQTQQQKDADFNNTPKQTATQNPSAQAQQTQGNRMGNFVTGAAAGYLLSEMLSPTEAQAQMQAGETAEQSATRTTAVEQLNQQAQAVPAQSIIPAFKAIEPQTDPFLIEKTQGYLRYCLNGVQYLISTSNTQLPPTLMVDRTNAPAACVITQ